jgi:catechol 2,3-dioxygenase-like lactoylglutathione lyase family enzyme
MRCFSAGSQAAHDAIPFRGVHHVGLLVEDLSRSLDFYCGTLGVRTTLRSASLAASSLAFGYTGGWACRSVSVVTRRTLTALHVGGGMHYDDVHGVCHRSGLERDAAG